MKVVFNTVSTCYVSPTSDPPDVERESPWPNVVDCADGLSRSNILALKITRDVEILFEVGPRLRVDMTLDTIAFRIASSQRQFLAEIVTRRVRCHFEKDSLR